MAKKCKKNIKKCREAVKNRQKCRKTVKKLSKCQQTVENGSIMPKKSKKTFENVEKL